MNHLQSSGASHLLPGNASKTVVNHFKFQNQADSWPVHPLFDLLVFDQNEDVKDGIDDMIVIVTGIGSTKDEGANVPGIKMENVQLFHIKAPRP